MILFWISDENLYMLDYIYMALKGFSSILMLIETFRVFLHGTTLRGLDYGGHF